MTFKPQNFFLRDLPTGFGKEFLLGQALPDIVALSGGLALGSSDDPPEPGSTLTLTDDLVLDPTPDTYEVTLQTRSGSGAWVTVVYDIENEAYVIPSGAEQFGTSWRVRAVATADGYETTVFLSNVQTIPDQEIEYVTHEAEVVTHDGEPVWVYV